MTTPLPTPDASALDVAKSILPNGTDAEVNAAAQAIGLFAANCVWQSVLEVAKKAEARTLARCAAEARRRAAGLVGGDIYAQHRASEVVAFAAWCDGGGEEGT